MAQEIKVEERPRRKACNLGHTSEKRTNLLFNKDGACNEGGPSNKTQGFELKDRIISSIKTYSLVIVTIVIILDIHLDIVELT